MSITDELRHLANEAVAREEYMYELPSELISIAERIDVMMGDRIELPKDADGVPIRIGDVMDNMHKDGFRAKRVTGICYHEGGKSTIEVDEDRLRWHDAYKLHHIQPDSWERIIEDATALGAQMDRRTMQVDDLVERCKRLAGEGA